MRGSMLATASVVCMTCCAGVAADGAFEPDTAQSAAVAVPTAEDNAAETSLADQIAGWRK